MDINDNLVKKIYNEKAATYSDIDSVLDVKNPRANAFHHFKSVNAINKFLKFKFDEKILDFGCGIGRVTIPLIEKGYNVIGIDISDEMLAIAKSKTSKKENFKLLNNKKFPLQDNEFDKVFSYWVLASMSDLLLEENIKEIHRVLKDNGKIFIFEQVEKVEKVEGGVHKKRTIEGYCTLFEKEGFKRIENQPISRMPSYAMSIWKKYVFLPKWVLPFLMALEQLTISYKKENIVYNTQMFCFRKES